MAKLIWSPAALSDLDSACDYIARDSKKYAYLFAERIIRLAETIARSPLLGTVVAEYGRPDVRERLFQNYRVIYRVLDGAVEIITIVHATRLLPPLPPSTRT
jgi:toxin ParE1/3/4